MYVSLEDVEISKAKEEHLKKITKENRDIEEDINTLRMISKLRTIVILHHTVQEKPKEVLQILGFSFGLPFVIWLSDIH